MEFGWELPEHFGDWQREYHAAVTDAVILDLSYRSTVRLTGRDRAMFLHNFCTNDILRTPVGSGCEAFLTTAQAKVLAWFHAFIESEAIELDADAGRGPVILQHLSRYQISEEVALEDLTGQRVTLHVCGPQAEKKLAAVLALAELPQQQHAHALLDFHGQAVRIRRLVRFGLPGWDVVSDAASGSQLASGLLARGVMVAGRLTEEVLRVEHGWPVFGRDFDETNLPQEIARDERAISFSKGCYLGQETVARIRAYGHVNRRLCGLRRQEPNLLPPGTPILASSSETAQPGADSSQAVRPAGTGEIGRVTSPVHSPRFGPIALGWLRRGYWQPGTAVLLNTPTGLVPATVAALPFTVPTAPEPSSR